MKNQTKYLVIEILDKVQLAKYVTYILQLDYRLVVVNCICAIRLLKIKIAM